MARTARRIGRVCAALALLLVMLSVAAVMIVWRQGRRTPSGRPAYVALGSSFAAGAGLGPLQRGSPFLCARSVNGYPQQLARRLGLSIVDMSCGGAVTGNVLRGGQFFQDAQIRAITRDTRLVTITVGGNDVGYVGDLGLLAARHTNSLFGRLDRAFWTGPKPADARDFATLRGELVDTLALVHHRAPAATVVVASYPAILPRTGTCARLGITAAEAELMRGIGDRLAAATRSAAADGHALLVDMHVLGADHDACSASPWTAGWTNATLAPFHPTLAGATATARAISEALADRSSADRGTGA